ncbi:MAG TPA: methyltransferase [Steroidobacteraceae bacterium]|jgi:hypothetical protein|nr:methyltransferase [Steroidobacteraceae bacterium]
MNRPDRGDGNQSNKIAGRPHMESTMPSADSSSAGLTMLRMAVGCWISQAIYVAAKLGIADLLQDGPRTGEQLAGSTQTHADTLYRVLRALASIEIFSEDDEGRFRLTPLAECLRSTAPGSLRAFAIMLGEPEHWRVWGDVLHSVKTGQPAFDHVFGMSQFQYFSTHAESARLFNEGMTSRGGHENDSILAAYDFARFATVVDIGGGEGGLLAAIFESTENTRGILFDLPHVVATARMKFAGTPQAERPAFGEGDFFEGVPAGADAYVLKKVIHNWDDERALSILKRCAAAMSRDARLLLIEPVVPPGNEPSFNKLLDLQMLVWTSGGRERTEAEHTALLHTAGLRVHRVVPTGSPLHIIEATHL